MEHPAAIFELGINHLGDSARARRMIDTLIEQGATTLTIQALIEPFRYSRDEAWIKKVTPHVLPLAEIVDLIRYAVVRGAQMGVVALDPLDVPKFVEAGASFFKILSGDITYTPLHHAIAKASVPLYFSTGASTPREVSRAVGMIRTQYPNADIRLIHTVIEVPTPAAHINLSAISVLKEQIGLPVAYGQHSNISQAMSAAIAAGAESVFIYVAEELVPDLPDGPHAVVCRAAKGILEELALVRSMMGPRERVLGEQEKAARPKIRRSIVAARAIEKGEILAPEIVGFKRPEDGMSVGDAELVFGKVASRAYAVDDTITL